MSEETPTITLPLLREGERIQMHHTSGTADKDPVEWFFWGRSIKSGCAASMEDAAAMLSAAIIQDRTDSAARDCMAKPKQAISRP